MKHFEGFKERLRYAMEKKPISATALAKELGCSDALISKYLKGRSAAPASTTVSLSQVLNVSYDWLRLGEGTYEDKFDGSRFYENTYKTFSPTEEVKTVQRVILKKKLGGHAAIIFNLTSDDYKDLMMQSMK
jgi:transcriptional regulator with XRE-family HTH domain